MRAGAVAAHARSNRYRHLRGQTLGLVGFGLIARLVAKKMSGFDVTMLAYDPYISAEAIAAEGVRPASLDSAGQADFVSCTAR